MLSHDEWQKFHDLEQRLTNDVDFTALMRKARRMPLFAWIAVAFGWTVVAVFAAAGWWFFAWAVAMPSFAVTVIVLARRRRRQRLLGT
ncbi:DUF3040 domain-containing protein [Catelliglobosispora koreensis]|uniref:DUF3040 domain-containing protein n=1 Tax=Catelliglobosispora koreensis TaxID=129052 RepID=UPI00035FB401|nr:DUF3040 domain-containing protein [Catelliglobosispora koreensis]